MAQFATALGVSETVITHEHQVTNFEIPPAQGCDRSKSRQGFEPPTF